MKTKIIIILTFLLISNYVFSQTNEFAPIGAKWWYSYTSDLTPYTGYESYMTIESIKDTLIDSVQCKILLEKRPDKITGEPAKYIDTLIMYSDSNKVYYYLRDSLRFCLLYDFNISVGQSWNIDCLPYYQDSTLKVRVDSIVYVQLNDIYRKAFYIYHNSIYYTFIGETIEGIGNINKLFPTVENEEIKELRCYEDTILGHVKFIETKPCDYISGIETNIDIETFKIYPNPIKDMLNIDFFCPDIEYIILTDVSGNILSIYNNIPYNSIDIDFNNYKNGIYFIIIINSSNNRFLQKIIKI